MDYMFSRVLGKGAHCIVKLENFSNSAIMEWFDSKFFRLPLKWKLQAALVSSKIIVIEESCNERNNKSLVSDISGLPGVSNELDNPTYDTTTVIQNSNESRNSLLKEITLSRG
ncbi:hypothetical protein T06_2887 [Trichinella sp. T6]|nr:hypothetical protein T06_2887 [Trichinella sp. T6]